MHILKYASRGNRDSQTFPEYELDFPAMVPNLNPTQYVNGLVLEVEVTLFFYFYEVLLKQN